MSVSERIERTKPSAGAGETLLEVKGLCIEGRSDERWHPIVKGVDLTLRRGEVLGLIGESGAGKSTIGLAAMGYARPGCRISAGALTLSRLDPLKIGGAARRETWGRGGGASVGRRPSPPLTP